MEHLAFYNVGSEPTSGRPRLKVWLRRQFRRILLPSSQRLVEILTSLCERLDRAEREIHDLQQQLDDLRRRHEDQAVKIPATVAFGWDYVAMVRRLAALEGHVDALMTAQADPRPTLDPAAPEISRARAG